MMKTTKPNFIRLVTEKLASLVKKSKNSRPPSDCLVLRLHYNYGLWLFGFIFGVTFYSWWEKELITCVSHFNVLEAIPYGYLNFCLTYLFVPSDENENERRYLFFYRWLHWLMLILAIFYFLVRKFAKSFENEKLRAMCRDVCVGASNFNDDVEKKTLEMIVCYLIEHLGSHSPVYVNAILTVIFALSVDLITFWFIDYLLHNRFYSYGLYALTTTRDIENFSDYISKTFPPFAKCHLEPQHQLTADRDEILGCHLGLMEVYEKLFFFVWVYLVVVIILTLGYLVQLGCYNHPRFQKIALRPKSPSMVRGHEDIDEKITKVLKHCKAGDVYVLLKLKEYLSDTRFYMLLCRLSEPSLSKIIIDKQTPQPSSDLLEPTLSKQGNRKPRKLRQRNELVHFNPGFEAMLMGGQGDV